MNATKFSLTLPPQPQLATMTLMRTILTKAIRPNFTARALSNRVADRGILFSAACPYDYQEELAKTPVDPEQYVEKGLLFSVPGLDMNRSVSDDADISKKSSGGFFGIFKF